MRIAILVPHVFMHKDILSDVIFAPGNLAIDLCTSLKKLGHSITFFSPGYQVDDVNNINADLDYFDRVLREKQTNYIELLKSSPLTFITLSRQVQNELIAKAFDMANEDKFDVVHVFTNEEESALVFSSLCRKPVLFTHHEPFNLLNKYKSIFPKYKNLNWTSISLAQRKSMPEDTNWVGNVYNGIRKDRFQLYLNPNADYLAFYGRIIKSKGVHLAIDAAKKSGYKIKIAGKHYSGFGNEDYWEKYIVPEIDNKNVEYVGFLKTDQEKQDFLGNAKALLMPSIWDEPFGMVMIEALACGTPIIGLNNGAIPEIILDEKNGYLAEMVATDIYHIDEKATVSNLVDKIKIINKIGREECRLDFEDRFTVDKMCKGYEDSYRQLVKVN